MANIYDKGDRVNINTSTVFQDAAGSVFDPDNVTFKVTDPAGATSEYEHEEAMPDDGRNAVITKNDTGDYTLTIDVDTPGVWQYYIVGEQNDGENRAADEGYFRVKATSF